MPYWTYRIEPTPAADDIEDSLAAPIHDPLWMLTRQWQLGEFLGDDAGSPAMVHVAGTCAPVAALGNGSEWRPYDRSAAPLDVLVEAEPPRRDLRATIAAGTHFLRLLQDARLERYSQPARTAFAIDAAGVAIDDPLVALLARAAPDPDKLQQALTAFAQGSDGALPFIEAADRARIRGLAQAWLDWWAAERACMEPQAADSWQPNRLEHQALLASAGAGGTVLRASEYAADSLDWVDFVVDSATAPPTFALPEPVAVALKGIPAPIRYGGMPANRYWELEDGRVDFGNVEAGAHDLGRLLLVEFAMVFGNDWFLTPLKLPSGTLTLLDEVVVSDVFGEHFLISRAGDQDATWDLFSLDGGAAQRHPAQGALFLPPSFGLRIEGDPLEVVHLLRDEMANLAWGIERTVTGADGTTIDRLHQWRRRTRPESLQPRGEPRYIVETEVPHYWLPFVPDQLADRRSHRLVLVPLAIETSQGPALSEPAGRLLAQPESGDPFWLYEEEVPREGVTVERRSRYIRWHGGRSFLWTARSKRTGRGEGSSGLRFDVVVPE